MVAGQASAEGSAWSRAASTSARRPPRTASPAADGASDGPVILFRARQRTRPWLPLLVQQGFAARVLHQHLDLALGLLQLAMAEPGQPDALLVELQRLLEGQVALLQLLHDLLELLQRPLEGLGGLRPAHPGSLSVTVARKVPAC